jgi:hypothetical protein
MFPSNTDGLRGITLDYIILEEAAYAKPELFYNVIAPLIIVNNTCCCGISSPAGDGNYYSSLTNIKSEDDGDPFIKVVNIKLVCDECLEKDSKATTCIHKASVLPPWKSLAKQKQFEKLYKGRKELFMRENLGVVTTDAMYFIDQKWVQFWLSESGVYKDVITQTPVVYIAIDPAGGGAGSMFAMLSLFIDNQGRHVVSQKYKTKQNKTKHTPVLFLFLFFFYWSKKVTRHL